MQPLTSEKIFTSLFAAFAIYIVWQSLQYGVFSESITGAGFFPAMAGLLILISTCVSLFIKSKQTEVAGGVISDNDDVLRASERLEVLRVVVLVAITVIFVIATPYLGMIALTPFYIMSCFLTLTPDRSAKGVIIGLASAIGFTLVAWAVFDKGLGVPLPIGLLWELI